MGISINVVRVVVIRGKKEKEAAVRPTLEPHLHAASLFGFGSNLFNVHYRTRPQSLSFSMPVMVSSSPGLTVAPSQNTASVVRFRCLYTHDLRRKAKRWQDGYLRYHTFNKRIMVFDEPGNFIGDRHWRQDEMIQDGDEFELDKGVLVQVAECMEKTETDLTPLFETRKASQGSPSQQSQQAKRVPVRSAVPSSQSQSSQSRSLNDLLGIKRTPVERLKSPYEQRHSSTPSRPAASVKTSNPTRERPVPTSKQPVVIDLSGPSVNEPPKGQHLPTPPAVQAPPRKARKTLESDVPRLPETAKPDHKSHSFSGNPQLPASSPAAPSSTAPSAPRNTLQLPKSKPRRKLMYQALLPGQKRVPETSSTSLVEPHVKGSDDSGNETNSTGNPMSTDIINPGNSTLDVLANHETDSGSDKPMSTDTIVLDNAPANRGDSVNDPSTDTMNLGNSTLDILANDESDNDTIDNPNHIPEAMAMTPGTSTQNILADMANDPISDSDHELEFPKPPHRVPGAKPNHGIQPQRNLQKAHSDPSAFLTVGGTSIPRPLSPCPEERVSHQSHGHDQNQDQNQVQDQGPWTCEAMDLFDFWPPGRLKQRV